MSGVAFTGDAAKRIAKVVRRVEQIPGGDAGGSQRPYPQDGQVIMLLADGDCGPASNPFTGATYVSGTVIIPTGTGATWATNSYTPQTMQISTRKEWIVNRSVDAQFAEDTFIIARRTQGEWLLIWHDCGPTERP